MNNMEKPRLVSILLLVDHFINRGLIQVQEMSSKQIEIYKMNSTNTLNINIKILFILVIVTVIPRAQQLLS